MQKTPSPKNVNMSQGVDLVKIPPYIIKIPTKSKIKAKLRILFILLE